MTIQGQQTGSTTKTTTTIMTVTEANGEQKKDRARRLGVGLMGLVAAVGLAMLVGVCVARPQGEGPEAERHHMSTKSSYWSDPLLGLPTSPVDQPPTQCKALFVNLIARHGTRNPTSKDINSLDALQAKLQRFGQYLAPQYSWLKTWTNPFQPEDQGMLVDAGEEELFHLAQRLQTRFSPLLSQPNKPYRYVYHTTEVPRAAMSGQSFGYSLNQNSGVLGSSRFGPFFSYSDTAEQDYVLRFFDTCPLYTTNVLGNASTSVEEEKFDDTVIQPMGIQMSKALGVFPQWQLSVKEFKTLWKGCAFDLSIFNVTDRFCTLFNASQFYEIEYSFDLNTYYENGYGNTLNYEIACPLLKEFVNRTDAYICGSNVNMAAKYRFAHAETVMPFISLLGLYRDPSPLKADWTPHQQAARLWKVSSISPYAANVVLVLYDCGSEYSVKALVNEIEVVLPGCPDVYCPYATFKSVYASAIKCDFVPLCYGDGQPPCGYPLDSDFVECEACPPGGCNNVRVA